MKNLQLIGLFLVVAGSFLPLVRIPIIGNWNYWKVDNTLAVAVWGFSLLMLVFILINKTKFVRIIAFLMILLFVFTIVSLFLIEMFDVFKHFFNSIISLTSHIFFVPFFKLI